MGDEVKTINTIANPSIPLQRDLKLSVLAATSAYRDEFKTIMGSEPIVLCGDVDAKTFRVMTYGSGKMFTVGKFSITELPGCCGIAVFYHAAISAEYTKRGLGRLFLKIRQKAAILAGYTVAQATVVKDNIAEAELLRKEGWHVVATFNNIRTGNAVLVLQKELLGCGGE